MTTQIVCPECGSPNVTKLDCGGWAWLKCRDCKHVWDDELEEQERHKKRKVHEEVALTE